MANTTGFSLVYISKNRVVVRCRGCGWECEDLNGMTWGPQEYNFCPMCGRKVVEVDDEGEYGAV